MPHSGGLGAGDGGGVDLLRAITGVVPEGMRVLVVSRQPLIVADELVAAAIHRRADGRVPA